MNVSVIEKAMSLGVNGSARLFDRLLVAIHWKPARESESVAVASIPFLAAEATPGPDSVPVSAPENLLGRDAELLALAEGRRMWAEGRRASMVIVGWAGSGKTSLINVAAAHVLSGLTVVRADVGSRLTTALELRALMARAIGLNDPSQLEEALTAQRRVVILDQLERGFLRKAGASGAIRELQRLIAATSSATLWIVSIGENAFRFLDTSLAFGKSFSHRISVGMATRDSLRQAILQRYSASASTLKFERPSATGVLQRFRNDRDAEALFFDSLWKASGGLYRTAFAMWRSHVERCASICCVHPVEHSSTRSYTKDLDLGGLFTLVSLLQHGGLSAEEHAEVFQQPVADSQAQMSQLAVRDLIEADGRSGGFRVRPEAAPLVHAALHRRNLL